MRWAAWNGRRWKWWSLGVAVTGAMCVMGGGMLPQAVAQQRDPRIQPNRPYDQSPRRPRRVTPNPAVPPPPRTPARPPAQTQPQAQSEPWWAPRTRLGIREMERALRADTPLGRGITAAHVEGAPGSYMPDPQKIAGARFQGRSGPSDDNSHAFHTARILYGRESLSPGVTDVHCYATGHWIGDGFLRTGTPLPPRDDDRRIYNHSWIANGSPFDQQVLRRVDYVVDQRDVIMVVGVNNGKNTTVPAMLGSAYNVIAVGSNDSSGGYTRIEGEGRCKPDIVAPTPLTSFATPMVGAIAARLLEMGDKMVAASGAASTQTAEEGGEVARPVTAFASKSQVIRAVLFAGAHKTDSWRQADGKPLDEHQGAGRVRFDNSYHIMSHPLASPDAPMGEHGWHYGTLKQGETVTYSLEVPANGAELSLVLVWNRRIDGRTVNDPLNNQPLWLDLPRMANLDLELVEAAAPQASVASSSSTIDNVEHIYLRKCEPGRYEVRVTRSDDLDETWDYALAWRTGASRGAGEDAATTDDETE